MTSSTEIRRLAPLALALCILLPLGGAHAGEDSLTLRVNDAEVEPGGLTAVVVRTYSSRPVGTGQLDFFGGCSGQAFCRRAGANPLVPGPILSNLEGHLIFSTEGDAQSIVWTEQSSPDSIFLTFLSDTATINAIDGPLAVLYLRAPEWVRPGTVLDLTLDPRDSNLRDENFNLVPIEVRPGILRVRAADEPRALIADGDRVEPGEVADIALETLEPFGVDSGRVVLTYDPSIAAAPPEVRFDPRMGRVSFTAETSIPGRIVVDFQSPDGTLNRIPGGLMHVRLPTAAVVPSGTVSPIAFDRKATRLTGPLVTTGLRLVNGSIEFE